MRLFIATYVFCLQTKKRLNFSSNRLSILYSVLIKSAHLILLLIVLLELRQQICQQLDRL